MIPPSFADIGKQAKDLLVGTSKRGEFQYNNKLTVNAKATEGVSVALKALSQESGLSLDFKGTLRRGSVTVEASPKEPKLTVTAIQPVIDGLLLTLSGSVPQPLKTGKLTAGYIRPHINSKASITLNADPVLDISAATGYNGFVLGGNAIADVKRSNVTSWALAAAYMGKDFVVTGHSNTQFETVTGSYWQQLDAASTVGAQVQHTPASNAVKLTMGYDHVSADGTLSKVKISNDGLVELYRETNVRADTSVAASVAINALDLSAKPNVGFAIDHSP